MKKIGLLVFLALSVRVAAFFLLQSFDRNHFYFSEFDAQAYNIISGRGYVFDYLNNACYFFNMPLYAYFLAAIRFIAGAHYFILLQIIQAVIAAFSVIPLVFIAKKIFNDERTAFLSALFYCFHPGLIVYTSFSSEFTLAVFFILTTLSLLMYFENSKRAIIASGIIMGLGLLLRPTLIVLAPASFFYLLIKKASLKKALFDLLIIVLLVMAVIAPWIYRGYKIYNRFIFISLTSAELFWRGNNPTATGTGFNEEGQAILYGDFRKQLFSLSEIEQNQFFKDEALRYVTEHPFDFLKLTLKKFIYFWSFSPHTGHIYPARWLAIYKLLYYFAALFFIAGIYYMVGERRSFDMAAVIFLFSFFIMISFGQSLFYINTKHRWLIEPLLMIFSSYGIQRAFSKKRGIR